MGRHCVPGKVKLIAGLLYSEEGFFDRVYKILEKRFGRIDYHSRILDFSHTEYYNEEMGGALKRRFLGFERLRDAGTLYTVKLQTNRIEKHFSAGNARKINIDPGYIDMGKLVLFSTKDHSHRIYLNKGVFSEVTLFYQDKSFRTWPWTYPDYKTEEYINIFNSIRERYKNEMRRKR